MTLICKAHQWTGLHMTHLPQYLLLSCVFVYVCVFVCVCISFHHKDFSWLKQNNKCNARDQASDVMLRKLLSVNIVIRNE